MRRWGRILLGAAAIVSGLVVAPAGSNPAAAATFTVTNLNAAGAGSLRQALFDLDLDGDFFNTIDFAPGLAGTILLESSLPLVYRRVKIIGPGSGSLTVDAAGHRLFRISDFVDFGGVTISGLTLTGAEAPQGAAVYASNAIVNIDDVRFTDNTASEDGGALYVDQGFLSVKDSRFEANSAAESGGAIGTHESRSVIEGSTFRGNQAGTAGSAVHASASLTGTRITSTQLVDNTGGALVFDGVDLDLTSVDFIDNTTAIGAAAAAISGQLTATDITMMGNVSTNGHIFKQTFQPVEITSLVVSGNTATERILQFGGASPVEATLTDAEISNNETTNPNGAIVDAVLSSQIVLERTQITDNIGTGIRTLFGSEISLRSSTIARNVSETVGGAALAAGSLDATNSTVASNRGGIVDGLDFGVEPGSAGSRLLWTTVSDNGIRQTGAREILFLHSAVDGTLDTDNPSLISAQQSMFSDANPGFTSAAGSTFGADLMLGAVADRGGPTPTALPLPGSPLVDAAGGHRSTTTDQRGQPAVSGPEPDIGAVEVQGGTVAWSSTSVSTYEGGTGVANLIRSGGFDPSAVRVADVPGSALPGEDYVAVDELVAWAEGENDSRSVSVEALFDDEHDDGHAFQLTIASSGGSMVDDPATTVLIREENPGFVVGVPPRRLLDTRESGETVDGRFAGIGTLTAGQIREVAIAGRATLPETAEAAVLNVTAVKPAAAGFITIFPCGEQPLASSLNFPKGSNVGNEVIATLSPDGAVCVYSSAATELTIDVVGYVARQSSYGPLVPQRLLDTRPGEATIDGVNAGEGRLSAGERVAIQVAGRGGVPMDASAAVMNVTAVGADGVGFVTADACGDELPIASSLNFNAATNRGNEVVGPLSDSGTMCLFVSAATHLTVDVVGWIPEANVLSVIAPLRMVDTRTEFVIVDAPGGEVPVGRFVAGETRRLGISGRFGVPAGLSSVVGNITAIAPGVAGFLTVWNCDGAHPNASSLNFEPGVNGGNEIVAKLSEAGDLCVFSSADVDLTFDLVGHVAM